MPPQPPVPELRKAFNSFDGDGFGYVSGEDFKLLCKQLDPTMDELTISKTLLLGDVKVERTGEIGFES